MAVLLGHRLSEKFLKPAEMTKVILFYLEVDLVVRTRGARFVTYWEQPAGAFMSTSGSMLCVHMSVVLVSSCCHQPLESDAVYLFCCGTSH